MSTKPCSRCGTTKPLTDYYQLGTAKDGRRSACKDCTNAAARAARSNPETRTYRLARRAKKRASRAAEPLESPDALTGGKWVVGKGGVRRWVA